MFGLSFGKNTSKQSGTTDQTQVQSGTQATTGTQATKGTTTTTGSQNTSSTGSSTTTGSTAATTGTTGTQQQTNTTNQFGQGVSDLLGGGSVANFISNILSSPANGGTAMGALGDFDAEQFVNSTMLAARNSSETNLGEVIRGVTGLIGGNSKENSASALLADRAKNDSAASLAGVQANAVKTAAEIQNTRAGTISGIGSAETNSVAQFLNAIKGGTTTTTGTTVNDSKQTQTGTQSGTTNTSENSNTSTQSQQMQDVLETINQLLATQGTTNVTGKTTGTDSKTGGGISLGI